MDLIDIAILAVIQGITEFLPISSSGHLRLWPLITGRPYQGVTMDVAVHLGTLVAVCLYFRAEVGRIFRGSARILGADVRHPDSRLVLLLALATVPAVLFGLALKLSGALDALDTDGTLAFAVIGWATLLGGLLLWLADQARPTRGPAEGWSVRDAVLMGLAQALALIPGTSRSGVTMTMARALGFDRVEAARLALLMSVPVILAAGSVETLDVIKEGDLDLGAELILGAVLSCLAALAALTVMMRMFAATWTMLPFVLYRLGLGAVLLWMAYG